MVETFLINQDVLKFIPFFPQAIEQQGLCMLTCSTNN